MDQYSIKIKFQKEENFPRSRKCVFPTTFHHQSTTISPSKNHVLHLTFRKNPSKNALHHPNKFFSHYHKKTRDRLPQFRIRRHYRSHLHPTRPRWHRHHPPLRPRSPHHSRT